MIGAAQPSATNFTHVLGNKQFEMGNHLGNVLAVVTDKKNPVDDKDIAGNPTADGIVDYYKAELLVSTDYYPFGTVMKGRDFTSDKYRYGFNGQEKVDEVKGSGNSSDFGERIYDARLGRWLSMEPFIKRFPQFSPYLFSVNNPISMKDSRGDSIIFVGINKNFVDALSTLLKTPDGKELLLKYWNSKTTDIYITVSDKDLPQTAYANTYPTDASSAIIKGNQVDITVKDPPLSVERMEKFQGIDVSKSKGRQIAFVTISGPESGTASKFKTAYALFHEIQSHIEDALVDMKLGVERFKVEHDLFGGKTVSFDEPQKFTPAFDIVQQLKALQSAEEIASTRKSEHQSAGGHIPGYNYDETSPSFPLRTVLTITPK